MHTYQLIGPFAQILPMTNLNLKGAIPDEALLVIDNGGILIENDRIHSLGKFNEMLLAAKELGAKITTLDGSDVCLPGFVDAHTHICFGGTRAHDYAMRNAGKSYLEIAKSGGGIWDTVTQTRKATKDQLIALIIQRANRHLNNGITTIEVKSGYGLSVNEELKMLYAIKEANQELYVDLIPTCLAAHMVPIDYSGTATEYLEEISSQLFPKLKAEQLCNRIDAFIEESAYSKEDIAPYFTKAKAMGFDITVHADQFSTSGSAVAIAFDAVSADHLEASTTKEIEALAKSNVIATALPGATLGLGCAFTPAREFLDAGGALAIASDWNPGSAPMGDLLTQAAILGTFQKLSNAEVLAGITFRAALALNLKDRGKLDKGHLADFISFPTTDYKEILYQQGSLKPNNVWKKGNLVIDQKKK
jgi:imidazolonepropionase